MRSLAGALTLAILCAAVAHFSTDGVYTQGAGCRVTTAAGEVQGALAAGTCRFIGVPYAAPPVGELRWRPPRPRAPWAPAIYDATNALRQCPQINMNTGAVQGMEDCLWLNVWAPASASAASRLPVLVWLHTGGFQSANAKLDASNGARFAAEREAIVVAPNYRLGPLGFLAHGALTSEDPTYPTSGNYGLADQRAALHWVRDNIAAFGGDPNRVTLAGYSAGAISTSLHLVSPLSRGLVHRAIMQSGQATARWRESAEAEALGNALAAALGCTDRTSAAACLRSRTINQVLTALPVGQGQFLEEAGRVQWGPVVDGVEVPDQPRELYRRGRFSRIPVIVGTVGDEGWTFVDRSFPAGLDALQYESALRTEFGMDADAILRIYPATAFANPKEALARVTADAEFVCEARRLARMVHYDGAPLYLYSFEYFVSAVPPGRAFHGLDSNFVFGNDFGAPSNHVLTPDDVSLFRTISTFWARFAETGDPNPRGQPVQWPPYRPGPFDLPADPTRSDRHFVFGDRLGVANYLRDPQCNFWESFYFRSALGAVPAAAR
jgi:para-nitrobenzyl esterase